MRCLGCHYDLQSLGRHRCPECGREFDPKDPYTFDSAAYRRRRFEKRLIRFAFYAAGSYALTYAMILYLELSSPQRDETPIGLLALVNWPITFLLMVLAFRVLLPRLVKLR